ncbi:MFS transporter [Rhizorhabdus wittichii]|uniref:MFS transporter n=1 Tax=Rhizorhabdus wittichii TaxID=160791 RepID=A0A975D1G5_9SPHN|nr:MFS transporter [Rhizorhabdus wittichii]QTH21182.1 MFS transporter [Rhizorhabdus wittichii]
MATGPSLPEWPDGLPAPRRFRAILAIWLAIAMAIVDGAIVNIALPTITRELAITPVEAVWVVNAYQVAVLVSLLPLSALGERFGCSRIYIAGLLTFIAASVGCAAATDLPMLVASRFLQGVGGACIQAMNGPMLRFTYPRAHLGRGIGYNALVVAVASASGPTLAAMILSVGSWHWLFAVNIPIGMLSLAIGLFALPKAPSVSRAIDGSAILLNAVVFLGLFYAANGWAGGGAPASIYACAIAGGVAAIMLVRRSRGQVAPLLPVDLLRFPLLRLSYATSLLAWAAQVMAFISLPFYLEAGLGLGHVETGLLLTPWPVAMAMAAPIAGRLVERTPAALLSAIGLGLMTLGLLLLAALPAQQAPWLLVGPMLLCGAGFAFFQTPNNRTLLADAPVERSGAAGGMLAVMRLAGQSGGAVSAALVFRLAGTTSGFALVAAALLTLLAGGFCLMRLRPPGRVQTGGTSL